MYKPTLLHLFFILLLIIIGYHLFYLYTYSVLKYFYPQRIEGFENAIADAKKKKKSNINEEDS